MKTKLFIPTRKHTPILNPKSYVPWPGADALRWLRLGLILLLASFAWQARASDPVGIYSYIDKVVFEPSEAAPERIQIFGGFAMAEGRGEKYAPAQKGFLYYTINPQKPEASLKEWKDLKSLAGTGQIVAFAGRYTAKGKVRPLDAKAESPDVYPLGYGLTKVKESNFEPVKELVQLRKKEAGNKEGSGKTSSKKGTN